MSILFYRAFSTELLKIATEVQDADIQAMNAEARGKEYLPGGQLPTNTELETNFKPKIAAGFMAYTPVGTYNVIGRKPAQSADTAYERAAGTTGTVLKGGMTGAGVASLGHTLMRGHDARLAPRHLGTAVGIGAGVALADRALRRRATKQKLTKTAMLNSQTFTPARELQTSQTRHHLENKVHHGDVKPVSGLVGRTFRLPHTGV